MLGPSAGLKSPKAWTVMVPEPVGVVLARYVIGSVAMYGVKGPPLRINTSVELTEITPNG